MPRGLPILLRDKPDDSGGQQTVTTEAQETAETQQVDPTKVYPTMDPQTGTQDPAKTETQESTEPKDLQIVVPERLNGKIECDGTDPFAKGALDLAKDLGLDQTGFNKLAEYYWDNRLGETTKGNEAAITQLKAEQDLLIKHYGGEDQTKTKTAELDSWALDTFAKVDGKLNEGIASEIELLRTTYNGTMLLESMRSKLKEQGTGRTVTTETPSDPYATMYPTMQKGK